MSYRRNKSECRLSQHSKSRARHAFCLDPRFWHDNEHDNNKAQTLVSIASRTAASLAIDYPLYNPSLTAIVRIEPLTGMPITAVLPPDQLRWVVPEARTALDVARDYVVLGFAHIWDGPDHLLFVAGLLLLARTARRIVIAVTGFTLAHSLTLSLAAVGIIDLPVAPVEAMIALSILFLAAEIARNEPTSFSRRYPVALSFAFGLLHGFGFASALGDAGLPQSSVAIGLLFFNIGVELGQLAFIAAAVVTIAVAMRALAAARVESGARLAHTAQAARIGAYGLGIPAAFWFLQRTAAAFGV